MQKMAVVGGSIPIQAVVGAPIVSEYEKERLDRIRANQEKIKELGVSAAIEELAAKGPQAKERKARAPKAQCSEGGSDAPSRRSNRVDPEKKVSYKDDEYWRDTFKGVPGLHGGGGGGGREARVLDEAEVAAMRERNGIDTPGGGSQGLTASAAKRGPVDSGKGVRIQGGKVYDSKYGVTCHWCRQKTLEDHVTCTNDGCGKGKRLPTTFCKNCLRNRHGEDSAKAHESGCWQCPQCRGSCGRGCVNCCNCGPCRKKAGLEPTHQIARQGREAGFDNVHDYLVHLVTGESQEDIAARKTKLPWGAWLTGRVVPRAEDDEAGEGGLPPAALAMEGSISGSCCTSGGGAKPQVVKKRRGKKSTDANAAADPLMPAAATVAVVDEDAAGTKGVKRPRGRPPLPGGGKKQPLTKPSATEGDKEGATADVVEEREGPVGAAAIEDAVMEAAEDDDGGRKGEEEEEEEEDEVPEAKNLSRKEKALRKLGLGRARR